MLFLAGDLTQWHLPVGMKDLNLYGTKVKGKATSEWKVTSQILLTAVQPHAFPHSSFSTHSSFLSCLAVLSFSQVTLRSGIFPWA